MEKDVRIRWVEAYVMINGVACASNGETEQKARRNLREKCKRLGYPYNESQVRLHVDHHWEDELDEMIAHHRRYVGRY